MNWELILTRFLIHGIALGIVIGFIRGWNRKAFHVLSVLYFAALVVVGFTSSNAEIVNNAFPSISAVIAQLLGALIGFELGISSGKEVFS